MYVDPGDVIHTNDDVFVVTGTYHLVSVSGKPSEIRANHNTAELNERWASLNNATKIISLTLDTRD